MPSCVIYVNTAGYRFDTISPTEMEDLVDELIAGGAPSPLKLEFSEEDEKTKMLLRVPPPRELGFYVPITVETAQSGEMFTLRDVLLLWQTDLQRVVTAVN